MGEHRSNGEVEIAIQYIQAHVRTMRLGLQPRYRSKIRMDHPIMAWLSKHSAFIRYLCMVGDDGRKPYDRRKGKLFLRPLPEVGERIWFQKPMSEGKDKLESCWECGLLAGAGEESNELYVLTDARAIKRAKCPGGSRHQRSLTKRQRELGLHVPSYAKILGSWRTPSHIKAPQVT